MLPKFFFVKWFFTGNFFTFDYLPPYPSSMLCKTVIAIIFFVHSKSSGALYSNFWYHTVEMFSTFNPVEVPQRAKYKMKPPLETPSPKSNVFRIDASFQHPTVSYLKFLTFYCSRRAKKETDGSHTERMTCLEYSAVFCTFPIWNLCVA